MKTITWLLRIEILGILLLASVSASPAPPAIHYQGVVTVDGVPFTGIGLFRFAILDAGETIVWSNDDDSPPVAQIPIETNNGLFDVILGYTDGMQPLSASLFDSSPLYLRVWFGDGVNSPQQLTPDQLLTSVGYSLKATDAETLSGHDYDASWPTTLANISAACSDDFHSIGGVDNHTPDLGSITAEMLASDIDASTIGFNADTVDGINASELAPAATVAQLEARIAALEATVTALEALLQGVTRVANEITFSGVNVKIISGSGATNGPVNGLGNLIVGYNEVRGSGDIRSGSHNLIVGSKLNYSSFGGMVVGTNNSISGRYASVSGGADNIAGAESSSVSGGRFNLASGDFSFVGGGGDSISGYGNNAFGNYSAILGGSSNITGDPVLINHTIGWQSTISGGAFNNVTGSNSSLNGGFHNTVSGAHANISSGYYNVAGGDHSSICGGSFNTAFSHCSVIVGGDLNITGSPASLDRTIGQISTISGGQHCSTTGLYSSVSGGSNNTAAGNLAGINGGANNTAGGSNSCVSGGNNRSVSGQYNWRAGDLFQTE